jgi:Leucine-rich repeat (LRR) protein
MAQGYIVSEPRKELVGGGRNAKYVLGELSNNDNIENIKLYFSALASSQCCAECTELYLGNKGIQKIRGFEDFINLEYLCLHGNRLKKINKLEANFRLKVLSAQVGV